MTIKRRLDRLAKRRGPVAGGVVIKLSGGGFSYRGEVYPDLAAIPGPGGALVIPETLPPAAWDPESVRVHAGQEDLIREIGK
ncbi:MAG: hypothetical protein NTY36_02250 [Deltaproteobacteria bacterium]|nr:hypothetical protein [Deltaproteobacteria bacterium]